MSHFGLVQAINRRCFDLIRRHTSNSRVPQLNDLLEVSTMLAEPAETWADRWVQEGMEKGLAQGREEGREEGQAALLQLQLSKRFGPLPEWARQRIEQAGMERIGAWAEAIFDAASLEALLGDAEQPGR